MYLNGCRFVGAFKQGVPHCSLGTLAGAKAQTGFTLAASGEWLDGQLCGTDCTWSLTLGNHDGTGSVMGLQRERTSVQTYNGGFVRGLRHGICTSAELADGTRYEGRYYNGYANGAGCARYPDGSVYRGKFIAGLRAGVGTAVFANGTSYNGLWEADQRHGRGVLRMPDGRELPGYWQRDVLQPGAQQK